MKWYAILILSCSVSIVGCGQQDASTDATSSSNPSPANYDQIKEGMALDAVEALMGKPELALGDTNKKMRSWTTPSGDDFTLIFEDDVVIDIRFTDLP